MQKTEVHKTIDKLTTVKLLLQSYSVAAVVYNGSSSKFKLSDFPESTTTKTELRTLQYTIKHTGI